jgi:hypothetical protein
MTRVPLKRRSLNKKLDDLIASFQPNIRAAFLSAIQDIRDTAILKELELAIEAGDVIGAFRALGFNAAAMRPLTAMIEQAFEAGGATVAGSFPLLRDAQGTRAVFRFDVRNSRAEAWLRDRSSTLVTRIGQETVTGLRTFLNAGMEAGINPRTTALDIVGRINPLTGRREGGIVGLTSQQQSFVTNAKRELASVETAGNWFTRVRRDKRFDSIVRKSISDGVALDGATITRLTSRYSDSLLKLRGDNIARTESVASLNRSSMEALQQAVDNGSIPKENVKRVWDSAGPDGRTRPDHLDMDGQEVDLNEPFHAPDGSLLMFPGDTSLGASPEETINCRCRVRLKVDWLATAE